MMIDAKGTVHVTPMQPGAPALGRAVTGE